MSNTPSSTDHFHFFDFNELKRADRYALMTATIIPRPIAVVSTLNENGSINLAPFSYFNAVSSDPPCLMFSVTTKRGPNSTFIKKDTLLNIERTKEFVVHISSAEHLDIVEKASQDLAYNVSELETINSLLPEPLQVVPSQFVSVPRVSLFKVAYECKLETFVELGANTVVFGRILGVHCNKVLASSTETFEVDPFKLNPLARLSRDYAEIRPSTK